MATVQSQQRALDKDLDIKISRANEVLDSLSKEVDRAISLLTGLGDISPTSENLQALIMFRGCLTAVKDVFGDENMTENVMTTAITASSYAAWRAIMGPKDPAGRFTGVEGNRR